MAEEKVVNLKINSNVVETIGEVDELNSALGKTEKKVDDVNEAGSGTSKLSGGFREAGNAIEGLAPGLKGAISGMKAMLVQMWAIVANPIGLVVVAIVGALTLLYKAFANSFEGGEKLEQIMAGISATGQALIDNLGRIGKAIIAVFKFDFSAAKKEIQGVANAATNAFNEMSRLTKRAQQLSRDQADNDLEAIKRQAKLADLKDKLLDDSISFKEKKKIQAELLKLSEENAKSDIQLAKDVANTKIAQLTLQKDGAKKNYVEIRKIQGEQLQGEIDNDRELKQIRKAGKTLENEEQASLKASVDEKKAQAKALADEKKRIDDDLTKAITENAIKLKAIADAQAYEAKNAKEQLKAVADANIAKQDAEMKAKGDYAAWELNLVKFNADQRNKIEAEAEEKRKEISRQEFENKMALLDATAAGLETLSGVIGQQTAAGKATAVAASLINTYAAIAGQLRAFAGVPIPGYAIVQAIATGLAGFAAVRNILKVQVPNSSGRSGGSVPSMGGMTAPKPTAPQFNVVGTSGINQIAQVVSKEQPPIKAYVVAKEVTTAQEMDRNIVKSSSLG